MIGNSSLDKNSLLTLTISKDLTMKKFALSLAALVLGLVSLTTPAAAVANPLRLSRAVSADMVVLFV